MSGKLLAAGAVLTVIAVATERHIPARQAESTGFAVQAVSGAGTAFEQITRSAVRRMIQQTDRSLDRFGPVVEAATGARGEYLREQYRGAEGLVRKAKQELESGRAFTAMDLALSASGRIGKIKKEFERE